MNKDEKVLKINRDSNSLFRCLAYLIEKKDEGYEKIRTKLKNLLEMIRNELVPSVIDVNEFERLISIASTPLKNGEPIHAALLCY